MANMAQGQGKRGSSDVSRRAETMEKQAAKRAKEALETEMEEKETDPARLAARHKAIAKGKNTLSYTNYIAAVPKTQRGRGHMRTPDPTEKISKRRFEGRIRAWRRFLHEWDKLETDGTEDFTADVAAEAADAATKTSTETSDAVAGDGAVQEASSEEKKNTENVHDPAAQIVVEALMGDDDFDKMLDFL